MAGEIRVYEQQPADGKEPGYALCLVVFRTKFERASRKRALTPIAGLHADVLHLLSAPVEGNPPNSEQERVERGDLSWIQVRVQFPAAFTAEQIDARIAAKCEAQRVHFKRTIEAPKAPEVRFLDLPERGQGGRP